MQFHGNGKENKVKNCLVEEKGNQGTLMKRKSKELARTNAQVLMQVNKGWWNDKGQKIEHQSTKQEIVVMTEGNEF